MSESDKTTASEIGTVGDALTVRTLGNVALVLAVAVAVFALILYQEISTNALLGMLILTGVGVGLRIEAAVRLRG
ncbi:hypothetical protein [Streptosporangium carneum]|uniref:Uncharacterized protein n=1 Tax=Streptosporangium carneum TaxID=47481 RepID=A0A9W6HVS0_9ACTN|nr:hypothetical protein [Streptosporangium carneum]GLK07230.1 hypothetical protein GCM10017600_06350 [Streptosporangium carneum]